MEDIIAIKTNTEEIENNRRTLEAKQKIERQNKITKEVIQSHKKNVEIDWNWQELEEKEDCKELAEDIEVQRAACAKIIEDKQALIQEFIDQLNAKDSHYTKAIANMSLDIESLIGYMMVQFRTMRTDYINQLREIEKEFERERSTILSQNETQITTLFQQHKQIEVDYRNKRQKLE